MTNHLKYPGTDIAALAGDVVRFWNDQDSMIVDEVITTEESRKRWGLEESGIMMVGPMYGYVFDSLDEHSEVELVERPKWES